MTEEAPKTEAVETVAPPEKAAADNGKDFIDFATAPPEIVEARFKRIYGNMKEYERAFSELTEHNAKLADRLEKLESDGAKVGQTREIEKVKAELKTAIEKGDTEGQVSASTKLTTLQTQAIQKAEKLTPPAAPMFDVKYVRDWSHETAEDGSFLRPWAIEGHPRYQEAFEITRQIAGQTDDVDLILKHVDEKMGHKPRRQTTGTVLGSGGRPPKSKEIQLSDAQRRVADKMGIPHEKYAKQLEAIR